jgi:hypothetical protein
LDNQEGRAHTSTIEIHRKFTEEEADASATYRVSGFSRTRAESGAESGELKAKD